MMFSTVGISDAIRTDMSFIQMKIFEKESGSEIIVNEKGRRCFLKNVVSRLYNCSYCHIQRFPTFTWMLPFVENLQLDNNNNSTTLHIQFVPLRMLGVLLLGGSESLDSTLLWQNIEIFQLHVLHPYWSG